jgi:hypothetical protein
MNTDTTAASNVHPIVAEMAKSERVNPDWFEIDEVGGRLLLADLALKSAIDLVNFDHIDEANPMLLFVEAGLRQIRRELQEAKARIDIIAGHCEGGVLPEMEPV